MAKVSVLDLTVKQTQQLEDDIGLPVNQWAAAPSLMKVYVAVLVAVNGGEAADYEAMTLRQIVDLVALDDSEQDPTPPSKP